VWQADDVAPFPLTITSQEVEPGTLLRLSGEIDLSSAHLLVDAIEEAVEAGATTVILDFAGVTFVNSTGLGTMVAATKRLRADGGDLVLRHFRGIPASALATTGLDRFFTIES
jgi:anti-sigma B factor antagonist